MNEIPATPAPEAPPATPDAPEPPPPSPGALVRQARERAGMAADELATQIKLAKNTLDALERDDFAALSEPVYVRGYYRKIAKVLPVSEAELLAAYNARTASARGGAAKARPAAQRIPLAGGVDAGATRRPHGQGIGLAIVVVVVAGLMFLLADKNSSSRFAKPAPAAPAEEPAAPPVTAPDSPAAEAPAAATTVAPDAGPALPSAVPSQLVLEFSESSFVRVEDSRNKTLAIGLVRGGERQTLDGTPPYSVFLGNAQNVKVYFSGRPVDFAAHINSQNDTARFTVP